MKTSVQHEDGKSLQGTPHLWLLLGITGLLSLFAFLRFGGEWGEGDTLVFTIAIRRLVDAGSLVTDRAYPNGYAYQTIVMFLSAVSGLQISQIQMGWSILLLSWVVIPAWLAYREFCRSNWAATLATTILFMQPEFLFPLLRGTHEKFTRGLMFLLLYVLLRSLRAHKTSQVVAFIGVFYLFAFGLITLNIYMATSFIISIGMAIILVWGTQKISPGADAGDEIVLHRLGIIILSLLSLAFVFMFYVYPPAQDQLLNLKTIAERVALLLFSFEDASTNPYAAISTGWISLPVYLLVSLGNWLLLIGSSMIWLGQSWSWIRKPRRIVPNTLLLWAFFTAFALQAAVSILIDLSNSLAANLQHRIFPSFVMLGAPYLSLWILEQMRYASPIVLKRLRWVLLFVITSLFALSALKAVNEPLLSNYWTFYTQDEIQSMVWADKHLAGRTIWAGYNPRMIAGFYNQNQGVRPDINLVDFVPDPSVPRTNINDFIFSSAMQLHSVRLGISPPMEADSMITYDNGNTRVYHSRPSTPSQR